MHPAHRYWFWHHCTFPLTRYLNRTNHIQTLPAGIAIPGEYKETDPGIVFNLYGTFTEYTIPGGPVSDLAAGGTSNTTTPAQSSGTNAPAPTSGASYPTSSAAGNAPTVAGGAGASTVTVYACSTSTSGAVATGVNAAAVVGDVAKWDQWYVHTHSEVYPELC